MFRLVAALASALAVASPSLVSACEGKNVVLAEKFEDDLNGWDQNNAYKFGGKGVQVTLPAENDNNRELNNSFLARNADFCLTGRFPAMVDEPAGFGLIFWATDYRNFFVFQVDSRGKASFYRYTAGRWIHVYSEDTSAINKEPGAANRIRVVTKGNVVSTYVNGSKIRDLRSQGPTGDARFGIYVQTNKPMEEASARTFNFDDYTVTSSE